MLIKYTTQRVFFSFFFFTVFIELSSPLICSRTFSSPQKETWYPFLVTLRILPTQPLETINLLPVSVLLPDLDILRLAFLTQLNVFNIVMCQYLVLWLHNIHLYGYTTFVHPPICQSTFELFILFGHCKYCSMNIYLQVLCREFFFFIYLGYLPMSWNCCVIWSSMVRFLTYRNTGFKVTVLFQFSFRSV